jgi:hypothetical protein
MTALSHKFCTALKQLWVCWVHGHAAALSKSAVSATAAATNTRTVATHTILLQIEESEIENLIQRERKQVERLEWLLEKVQQDYAYFGSLQKRFEGESSYNQGDSRYDQGGSRYNGSSSSSGGGGGGRWGL